MDLEEEVIREIGSNGRIKIGKLINNIKKKEAGVRDVDVAKAIYRLKEEGRILYLNAPTSFLSYFFSPWNAWVLVSIAIITASALSSLFIPSKYILIKGVVVSPLLFFYPGYGVVESVYPNKNEWGELERVALYIGISLAIIPLIGLILNLTPQGLTVASVSFSLYTFSFLMLIVSSYRKSHYFMVEEGAVEGGA
ncbi:MAG: DUF1616 domain-containing protein [Caldisphaeraceae archaeon]|nr:DUF1616 domain-containing protein [Caldisphaeraceae archaeon]